VRAVPETIEAYTRRALSKSPPARKPRVGESFSPVPQKNASGPGLLSVSSVRTSCLSFLAKRSAKTSPNNSVRPQLALTFDDPTLSLGSVVKWPEANRRL